jgi:hypothetical protein
VRRRCANRLTSGADNCDGLFYLSAGHPLSATRTGSASPTRALLKLSLKVVDRTDEKLRRPIPVSANFFAVVILPVAFYLLRLGILPAVLRRVARRLTVH